MYNNIIFIGGIHGVGKSTVCREICKEYSINYLSASDVLKWEELNTDVKNKKVEDIPFTQDRLIEGLRALVKPDEKYLLDGHFCLFDGEGKVTTVPIQTFLNINPILLVVILGNPDEIRMRLNKRDNKGYTLADLDNMQKQEVEYSSVVAENLRVKCIKTQLDDVDIIFKELNSLL